MLASSFQERQFVDHLRTVDKSVDIRKALGRAKRENSSRFDPRHPDPAEFEDAGGVNGEREQLQWLLHS